MECNFFATKPRNSRSSSVLFGINIYECSYLSVQSLLITSLFAHVRTLQGHHYLMIKRRGGKFMVVWVVEMKINKTQTHLLHSHSHSQSSSMDCCFFWHDIEIVSAEFTGVYVNLMRVFRVHSDQLHIQSLDFSHSAKIANFQLGGGFHLQR